MLANQTVGISRVTRPRGNRCFRRLLLSMAIIFHVTALSLGCSCPIPLFSYVHASRDATTSPFNNSVRRRRVTTTFSLLFLDFRTSCLVLLFIFFFWLRFFPKQTLVRSLREEFYHWENINGKYRVILRFVKMVQNLLDLHHSVLWIKLLDLTNDAII